MQLDADAGVDMAMHRQMVMALRDPSAGIGIDLGEAVRHERGACVACPLRGHEDVDVADEACRRIGMECIDQAGGPLEEHRIHAVVGKDCCHAVDAVENPRVALRSEEHTSEPQSLMIISYAVFCLKKKTEKQQQ